MLPAIICNKVVSHLENLHSQSVDNRIKTLLGLSKLSIINRDLVYHPGLSQFLGNATNFEYIFDLYPLRFASIVEFLGAVVHSSHKELSNKFRLRLVNHFFNVLPSLRDSDILPTLDGLARLGFTYRNRRHIGKSDNTKVISSNGHRNATNSGLVVVAGLDDGDAVNTGTDDHLFQDDDFMDHCSNSDNDSDSDCYLLSSTASSNATATTTTTATAIDTNTDTDTIANNTDSSDDSLATESSQDDVESTSESMDRALDRLRTLAENLLVAYDFKSLRRNLRGADIAQLFNMMKMLGFRWNSSRGTDIGTGTGLENVPNNDKNHSSHSSDSSDGSDDSDSPAPLLAVESHSMFHAGDQSKFRPGSSSLNLSLSLCCLVIDIQC